MRCIIWTCALCVGANDRSDPILLQQGLNVGNEGALATKARWWWPPTRRRRTRRRALTVGETCYYHNQCATNTCGIHTTVGGKRTNGTGSEYKFPSFCCSTSFTKQKWYGYPDKYQTVTYCSGLPENSACGYSDQCQSPLECKAGSGGAKCRSGKSAGEPCTWNGECIQTLGCSNGICAKLQNGEYCRVRSQCASNKCGDYALSDVSNGNYLTREDYRCCTAEECESNGYCRCINLPLNTECNQDSQCTSGFCSGNPELTQSGICETADQAAARAAAEVQESRVFQKAGLHIPSLGEAGVATSFVGVLKRMLRLTMVPACSVETVKRGGRGTACPPGSEMLDGYSCMTNCNCRLPCPDHMEFCSGTSFCYDPRSEDCGRIKGSQAIAIIGMVLNFIPGVGQIKMGMSAMKTAAKQGYKAFSAAMKTCVKSIAQEFVTGLVQGALVNIGLYFLVNGRRLKTKYIDAFINSDGEDATLAEEVYFQSMAARDDEVKKDVENFFKTIDPTGVSDILAAFSKPSCANLEPMKTMSNNSAFALLPVCLFEGNTDCSR